MMDEFDRFWQWANKALESTLTIPADSPRDHVATGAARPRPSQ
jgi:hypothetical protein